MAENQAGLEVAKMAELTTELMSPVTDAAEAIADATDCGM